MALSKPPDPLWVLESIEPERVSSLARELGVPRLLAELLLRRGLSEGEEARLFLDSSLSSFCDPFLFEDMEAAVERLMQALSSREPVGVFADYDVDGVSAAALLIAFLRSLGAETHIYIPHRLREGYGLNLRGLQYLREKGCRLVVAVDCGTASLEEVEEAGGLGLSVIVADHHEPGDELPPALALLNPMKPESRYPDRGLTGVGVTLKLAAALRSRLRERGWPVELPNLREMLDLVALGTVADVALLRGENRTLVSHGLRELAKGRRVGVAALKEVSGLGEGDVTAGQVGFILAPRLNAAGRLGEAGLAAELLLTGDRTRARALAERLEALNRERQALQEGVLTDVRERLKSPEQPEGARAIVLASPSWHPGVLGIVAARVAEQYFRPTALIAIEGERGKGSARSIPTFDLYRGLIQCSRELLSFGGHRHAAGITIETSKVEAFRERLDEAVGEQLGPEDFRPRLILDGRASLPELTLELVQELSRLSPHGRGNPRPVLLIEGAEVMGEPRLLGREGQHLRVRLRQRGKVLEAIGFQVEEGARRQLLDGGLLDLAVSPGLRVWGDRASVELQILGVRPAGPSG